ncbi:uncharacterized protein MICPUCDRAFT_69299 [Micromonas pusilla CCMP1545]|uniref:Predicted protein n=1 Tax=Micromonas pusilla (strain CCMP1545) TaxID=564608 RepID=C1MY65_MICPC|nr:uncharacterized protein MICPUCDRAFT_69299 [Micromonas pusilla CCMP1545]EEH55284.1 predicted protein [Micromonas pusilla CCMP1545]|eukprot:XP_003060515.1 predicted protein [Micromonas pusilla CCMP1545]
MLAIASAFRRDRAAVKNDRLKGVDTIARREILLLQQRGRGRAAPRPVSSSFKLSTAPSLLVTLARRSARMAYYPPPPVQAPPAAVYAVPQPVMAQPTMMQQPVMQQPMVMQAARPAVMSPMIASPAGYYDEQKYCGPISLCIGFFIFPCICCCPVDTRRTWIPNKMTVIC